MFKFDHVKGFPRPPCIFAICRVKTFTAQKPDPVCVY